MMNITEARTQIALIYSKRELYCLYRLVACGKDNPAEHARIEQELLTLFSEECAFIPKHPTLPELLNLHRLLVETYSEELTLTDKITEKHPYAWAMTPEEMAAELKHR